MDTITKAAKDYVVGIATQDHDVGGENSKVVTKHTYPGIEAAFVAGAKWVCERAALHLMPEDLYENEPSSTIDELTVMAVSKRYVLFLKSGKHIIATRVWSRTDPVWRWQTIYGTYIEDEDVVFWSQNYLI